MRRAFCFLLSLCCAVLLMAQRADSVRISLITCSPGTEVYALYGHTAIRCQCVADGQDVVFNYGVFSFDQPHFIWHFVLGQCDYMVLPVRWDSFLKEYQERGSQVTGQVLNLTHDEAAQLYANLVDNCRSENCQYRYNFFYNNCTTMVRDMIERAVDGHVVYPDTLPRYTHRQMLHQYTSQRPWTQEGQDILLGADVDTVLSDRAIMFAPEYMMQYADRAVIRSEMNDVRPLVKETEILLQKRDVPVLPEFPLSPLLAAGCMLLSCLLVVGLERLLNWQCWLWDVVLLLLQGAVGVLLGFMALFSEHPAVGNNWLLLVFNPLAWLGISTLVKAAWNRRRTLWHAVYFVVLTLFMLFSPWMPQDFGNIVVPLTLALLTRPISYYLYYQKNKL